MKCEHCGHDVDLNAIREAIAQEIEEAHIEISAALCSLDAAARIVRGGTT